MDQTVMWVVIGLTGALGVPVTLWWWKEADRWADEEHRRFKPKTAAYENVVVVRTATTAENPNATKLPPPASNEDAMTSIKPHTQVPAGSEEGASVPIRFKDVSWEQRLEHIVDTMREMSTHTDPQAMVQAYGKRMRGTITRGHTVSISRRDLEYPLVRVTRNTQWATAPDPWKQRELLPIIDRGILSELIYADEPRLFRAFSIDPSDPAHEYLSHAKSLIAIPHYENGVALNMALHTSFEENSFDPERFPELVQMSNLFGRATRNLVLSRDLKEAYESLDRELRTVQQIQLSLLPQHAPSIPGLSIATQYEASSRAGGDYYDFFTLPDNRWGVLIADVSGHGTPAAVLMAIVHAIAHLMPGDPWPPDRAMSFVNKALYERYTRDTGAFVTMIYGIYNATTREFSYSNAGHPPAMVRYPSGTVVADQHPEVGLPLGILPDATYATHTLRMSPGESVVLYTDGITEAFCKTHTGSHDGRPTQLFGEERLAKAIARGGQDADAIVSAIIQDVGEFAGIKSRSDDRTIVVASVG